MEQLKLGHTVTQRSGVSIYKFIDVVLHASYGGQCYRKYRSNFLDGDDYWMIVS